ncbi:MAG: YqeG family HAD IIIA-type phosphatase [Eubacteriales bacterium]|nr:YqeG family HAD IIIA-type phosphatase [Eubacteriales bacterium]
MTWKDRYRPDIIYDNLDSIDLQILKNKGIKGIVLDIDNTISEPGEKKASPGVEQWIRMAANEGFEICVLSNSSQRRVDGFTQNMNIAAIGSANKPSRRSFRKAACKLSLRPDQVAVIGDQLFTDISGGNRAGMYTVLVTPINTNNEWFFIRFKRVLERIIKNSWDK